MEAANQQRKIIEHYSFSLGAKIGKGFSSVVYRGRNDHTGETVAIKVIEMRLLEEDDIYKSLLRMEIEALKGLAQQPQVLNLYDTYSTKNNTYLMTEFCQSDLAKHLKARKVLPLTEATAITQQILSGYLAVHRAGYVHRDIKPANIFLKDGKVKLADFGFAVPLADLSQHQHYNVGSPQYMPPEALKDNLYSFSSDLWAVGVILFQMLRGCAPWKARSEQMLYSKLLNEPIDQMTGDLHPKCKEFLSRVLHVSIEERLTVQEMNKWIEVFRELAYGERISSQPVLRPTLSSNQNQRENKIMGPAQMKKDINSDNRSDTSTLATNMPPLRQVNLNCGITLALQHTTSSIANPNSIPAHKRDNSIPAHIMNKADTSRSPAREVSIKGPFKTRYNAVTPKTREGGFPFEDLAKVPQTTTHCNQPIVFPDSRNEVSVANGAAEGTITSYLNFCKFLYKLLQILSSPLKYQFSSALGIQGFLTNLLNLKMKRLVELFERGHSLTLFIQGWPEFQSSPSFNAFKTKTVKTYRKYSIMYPPSTEERTSFSSTAETTVQRGIHELMEHLRNSFDEKSVILLDYLTTVYQLLDLDRKYEPARFASVSKIDVIVQGSPFNVSSEHLGRLLNKIAIIGV